MLLSSLQHYYPKASPLALPWWDQFIKNLQPQKQDILKRYLVSSSKLTQSTMLLYNIISKVDITFNRKLANDYLRYNYYFKQYDRVFKNVFDPVTTGKGYTNMFYNSSNTNSTIEYLCPTDDVDHIKILPLDKNFSYWEKLEPVHFWYHDSLEYTLNLQNDKTAFYYNQPNYTLVFIDVVMLSFMYYKYLTTDIGVKDKTPFHFLKTFVFSKFFTQLQDTFILNTIDRSLDIVLDPKKTIEGSISQYSESRRDYGYKGEKYIEAIKQFILRSNEIKSGALAQKNLLNSELFNNGLSIRDKILHSFEYLDLPHLYQYQYLELLRDLPYLSILMKLYNLRQDDPMTLSMFQTLRIKTNRLLNNDVVGRVYNQNVKEHVKLYIKDLNVTISKIA